MGDVGSGVGDGVGYVGSGVGSDVVGVFVDGSEVVGLEVGLEVGDVGSDVGLEVSGSIVTDRMFISEYENVPQ